MTVRAFLGGSFDPVHSGHVAMARHVLAGGLASMVHVVPAWQSPHKNSASAPVDHRLAMVELAFPAAPGLVVDTREIDSRQACYTVDTLAALQAEHGPDTWLLLIGADNLPGFPSWHESRRLASLATVVVFARQGRPVTPAAVRAAGLDPARTLVIGDFDRPVSSSAIRAMLADRPLLPAGLMAGGLPEAVARHIIAHKLYLPHRNGESRVPDPD